MTQTVAADLQQLAKDHLWMHFTRMGGYRDAEMPIIVRGDGLLPRGRQRQALPRRARRPVLGQHRLRLTARRSGRRRSSRCASCPSTRTGRTRTRARSSSRPRSRRSRPATSTACSSSPAARRRSSRRGSSRGSTTSRAGRSGCARRRLDDRAGPRCDRREPARRRPAATRRSRAHTAYHGTTLGALSLTGIPAIRMPFEPLRPRGAERPQHEPLPPARRRDRGGVHRRPARRARADDRGDGARDGLPRPHGAGAELGWRASRAPVGYWQGVRELCDRYDILLSADEVITGFGRIGDWFASERYDIRPDIITSRQGPLVLVRRDRRRDRDRPRAGAVPRRARRCTRTASRSADTP